MGEKKEQQQEEPINDGANRPSISVKLVRHAESRNNQVYRNARYIYRGGTPDFDQAGWTDYVDKHRKADPGLSDTGTQQAQCLADYLTQHVTNQCSQPFTIISSPMKRTLETIRPTFQALTGIGSSSTLSDANGKDTCRQAQKQRHQTNMIVHGFYFESEGCHIREVAQEGMNPKEIQGFLASSDDDQQQESTGSDSSSNVSFVGFPDPKRGWYCNGTGGETRASSEVRAAKFYVWLCEHLDQQLQAAAAPNNDDVFDAGVSVPGEEGEVDHDRLAPRQRKRRTCLLVGHGDFMSLVLKRIVAGFGHYVEKEGVSHRSAFVHQNSAFTELEYFGAGRFLVMSQNATPHLLGHDSLRTGGSLKDGWSYLMPNDEFVLDGEVAVAFSDEELQDNEHVREQTQAIRSLYHLGAKSLDNIETSAGLSIEQQQETNRGDKPIHFIVQRGLQVVGTATYSEDTGIVSDVAVRPSGGIGATKTLLRAVKEHAQGKLGRSGSLLVRPRSTVDLQHQQLLDELGFEQIDSLPERANGTTEEKQG